MKILFDQQYAFNRIIVEEDKSGVRTLKFGEHVQGRFDPHHLITNQLHYIRTVLKLVEHLPTTPKRVLCIGLGAGTFQKAARSLWPKATLGTVEIDPLVIQVARDFFDFREAVALGNGRTYLEGGVRGEGLWDLIFVDAFDTSGPARTLQTVEAARLIRDRLVPQEPADWSTPPSRGGKYPGKVHPAGVAIMNTWGPNTDALHGRVERAWRETFEEFESVIVHPDPKVSDNRIFVGRGVPAPLKDADVT